jgi:hypothetical protein
MWNQRLHQLKDYILANNTYLTAGFASAWWDSFSHKLLSFDGKGNKTTVFPVDNLGDYFYLRMPSAVKVIEDPTQAMGQCTVGYRSSGEVILVCMMRDGCPDKLMTNLISTIQRFDPAYLRIKNAVYQNEFVIAQEFGKDEKLIEAAMQRVKNSFTFVSITIGLELPIQYINQSCITKPCRTC